MQFGNPEDFKEILDNTPGAKRNKRIIYRDARELEREELQKNRRVIELENGKYVIEEAWIQTVTHHIIIREFDPTQWFADAASEFTEGQEDETG